MGRQICYFITQDDINKLVEAIYLNNGIILNYNGKELTKEELTFLADYEIYKRNFGLHNICITRKDFKIIYNFKKFKKWIDMFKSEVITFSLCTQRPEKIIDTSLVSNNFTRNGFLMINDRKEYDRQIAELMKNPTYIDNPTYLQNGYEHGRLWYEHSYYDKNGVVIRKPKELDDFYNKLKKYITKNYKLTADKFGYIGPVAYEKYKEGVFIPASGRNAINVE